MTNQKFNQNTQTNKSQTKAVSSTDIRKQLFKFSLEMKFISLEQIEKKFFTTNAFAEINQLVADGYFRIKDRLPNDQKVYIPTDKAHAEVYTNEPTLPQAMKSVWAPRVNHDLKLADLRIRFEELNFIKKWTSERMLEQIPEIKEMLNDVPDAVCRKKDDRGYFLELEISQKTKAQYEFKIGKYLEVLNTEKIQKQKIDGVIFMCLSEKVQDFIKALLPKDEKRISVLCYDRYFRTREESQDVQSPKAQDTANPNHKEQPVIRKYEKPAVHLRTSGAPAPLSARKVGANA